MVLDGSEMAKSVLLPPDQLLILLYAGLSVESIDCGSVPISKSCELVERLPTALYIRFVVQMPILDIELAEAAWAEQWNIGALKVGANTGYLLLGV